MNTTKNNNRQKSTGNTVVSIILFILTGMTLIFAVRQVIYCNQDVVSALEQGMTLIDNLGDIVFYYLESCGQYLFTGGILFALAWIILHQGKPAVVAAVGNTSHQENGDANSDESKESDKSDGDDIDAFVEEDPAEKKDGNI